MAVNKSLETQVNQDFWSKKRDQAFVVLSILVIFTLFTKAIIFFQELVISYMLALIINYLLSNPVNLLSKYLKFRALSIVLILLPITGLIFGLLAWSFPILNSQLLNLEKTTHNISDKLANNIGALDAQITGFKISFPSELYEALQKLGDLTFTQNFSYLLEKLKYNDFGSFLIAIFLDQNLLLVYLFLISIFSIYLLLDGNRIWSIFISTFPKKMHKDMEDIKARIDHNMNSYITGQFQIATLTSLVMLSTYFLISSPHAILLALIQLLEVIPLIGTWIAIVPAIFIILVSSGPTKALIALSAYLVYTQIIRDNFIAPKILGNALGSHPVFVISALVIAAKLAGLLGLILCLPLLALVGAILSYFLDKENTHNLI